MKITNREEAKRIVFQISAAYHAPEATERILDAIYGKPESERLLLLRSDRNRFVNWQKDETRLDTVKATYQTAIDLIDAAIKEEEAK